MAPTARQWADQAQYDLETARAMLASSRYLYVLFCCQQAAEKALKALIVDRTGEFPPRIHSLPWLAEAAQLDADPSRRSFLAELSAYYIQTRYPESIDALSATATRFMAEGVLKKTEDAVAWLLSMMK